MLRKLVIGCPKKKFETCFRGMLTNALSRIKGTPQYSIRCELICWGRTRRNAIGRIWEKEIAGGKP
jgi:hypothetical protein